MGNGSIKIGQVLTETIATVRRDRRKILRLFWRPFLIHVAILVVVVFLPIPKDHDIVVKLLTSLAPCVYAIAGIKLCALIQHPIEGSNPRGSSNLGAVAVFAFCAFFVPIIGLTISTTVLFVFVFTIISFVSPASYSELSPEDLSRLGEIILLTATGLTFFCFIVAFFVGPMLLSLPRSIAQIKKDELPFQIAWTWLSPKVTAIFVLTASFPYLIACTALAAVFAPEFIEILHMEDGEKLSDPAENTFNTVGLPLVFFALEIIAAPCAFILCLTGLTIADRQLQNGDFDAGSDATLKNPE